MFSDGYGFVVDYLAEIFRHLRNEDLSFVYQEAGLVLSNQMSTRDRDAINKTMSGFLKLIFPDGDASVDEIEELISLAIEGRKRVKDQLKRIDSTYPETDFYFVRPNGTKCSVTTLEEDEYPMFYYRNRGINSNADTFESAQSTTDKTSKAPDATIFDNQEPVDKSTLVLVPCEDHIVVKENRKGITFKKLFGPWLKGVSQIVVTDPYIRTFHQINNMMEFLDMVIRQKAPEEHIAVELITTPNDNNIVSVKKPPFSGDCQEKNMNIFHRNIKFIGEFYCTTANYPMSGGLIRPTFPLK